MGSLFKMFWKLCAFKIGPEDMPVYGTFLWVFVFACCLLEVSANALLLGQSLWMAVKIGVSSFVVFVLFIRTLLSTRGMLERFPQTLLAFIGVDLLFNLMTLPLAVAIGPIEPGELQQRSPTVLDLMLTVLQIWSIAVNGMLFSRALSIPMFFGVMLSIFSLFLMVVIYATFAAAEAAKVIGA